MTAVVWLGLTEALAGIPDLPGAACKGRPEWFDLTPDDDPELIERAELVCRHCPALAKCRDWLASTPRDQRPSGVVAGRLLAAPAPRVIDTPPATRAAQLAEQWLRAERWLHDYLDPRGSTPGRDVLTAAKAAGIPERALNRARRRLGVIYTRPTHRQPVIWRLPPDAPDTGPDRALGDEQPLGQVIA